jgi:hypothetical protein
MLVYEDKEATYTGRSCKVYGVPIRISAPGSIVEYTFEQESFDIGFGIIANLDQGVFTTVGPFEGGKDNMSVQEQRVKKQWAQEQPPQTVSDQLLVGAGNVSCCTLTFQFENNTS